MVQRALPCWRLRLRLGEYLSPVPAIRPIWPLKPFFLFFFVMMLITPAPEASYFAEGLVMISTCEICEAGIWSRREPLPPLPVAVGLPSMRMVRLEEPRMLTTPLASTATEGTF